MRGAAVEPLLADRRVRQADLQRAQPATPGSDPSGAVGKIELMSITILPAIWSAVVRSNQEEERTSFLKKRSKRLLFFLGYIFLGEGRLTGTPLCGLGQIQALPDAQAVALIHRGQYGGIPPAVKRLRHQGRPLCAMIGPENAGLGQIERQPSEHTQRCGPTEADVALLQNELLLQTK
jgi:hypothetical protein